MQADADGNGTIDFAEFIEMMPSAAAKENRMVNRAGDGSFRFHSSGITSFLKKKKGTFISKDSFSHN